MSNSLDTKGEYIVAILYILLIGSTLLLARYVFFTQDMISGTIIALMVIPEFISSFFAYRLSEYIDKRFSLTVGESGKREE